MLFVHWRRFDAGVDHLCSFSRGASDILLSPLDKKHLHHYWETAINMNLFKVLRSSQCNSVSDFCLWDLPYMDISTIITGKVPLIKFLCECLQSAESVCIMMRCSKAALTAWWAGETHKAIASLLGHLWLQTKGKTNSTSRVSIAVLMRCFKLPKLAGLTRHGMHFILISWVVLVWHIWYISSIWAINFNFTLYKAMVSWFLEWWICDEPIWSSRSVGKLR